MTPLFHQEYETASDTTITIVSVLYDLQSILYLYITKLVLSHQSLHIITS